eukprot:scaffold45119_cov49-Attheya_sp.AAC.1
MQPHVEPINIGCKSDIYPALGSPSLIPFLTVRISNKKGAVCRRTNFYSSRIYVGYGTEGPRIRQRASPACHGWEFGIRDMPYWRDATS